jgi:hypothetical protein
MHYGTGVLTSCKDVLASEFHYCSDLNTTHFLKRIIEAEKPDFIAFTGIHNSFLVFSLDFFFIINNVIMNVEDIDLRINVGFLIKIYNEFTYCMIIKVIVPDLI